MCRLIALDVDGTLLDSGGRVPESAVKAIQAARSRGIRVVLATGRSGPEAVWLSGVTGCDSRAVVLGGAAIADAETGRHLRRWDMAEETGVRVLELLRGAPLVSMVFAGETNLLDPASAAYFRANYHYDCFHNSTTVAEDLPAYLRDHGLRLTKVHARGDPAAFPPLLARLREIPGLSLTSSGPDNFEVVSAGVDKGAALRELGGEWGIGPQDMAAVGDSDNDLAMLGTVGWPVAMGNASDAVKAVARMVTGSNDEDGVAGAIYRLMGQQEGET